MPSVANDLRSALRALRRNTGFTATAVAALSLGIAANTAIFSVVNKVLIEPLPYPAPDRLVQLVTQSQLGNQNVVSVAKYEVWRDHMTLFQSIAAYDTTGPHVNLTEGDQVQPLPAARVSPDYFRLFGGQIKVGRAFSDQDAAASAPCTAVIGEDLWRRRFRSAQSLVGSVVSLDHAPCKVIGVLASGLVTEKPTDVWLPLEVDPPVPDHIGRVRVAARLKPGVTLDLAAAETAKTKGWFLRRYRSMPLLFGETFTAISLRDAMVGDVRRALLLLTGAVGFVLLIACANVGSLVLARASRRTQEIALRAALGARRTQLIRQLLAESILLAMFAGVAGLLLGFAAVRGLLALSPADLPRVGANGAAISLDWRVFLFTFAISIASGVLFGLLPALSASRTDVMSLVKENAVPSGMGLRRKNGRSLLVIAQVALALVLLAGAGLLIRTFVTARTANPGFDEDHVLTAEMSLAGTHFEPTGQVAQLVRAVEQSLKKLPGVTAVAAASSLPLEPALSMPFTISNRDQSMVGRYHGAAGWRSVSPDYFAALHIRVLGGRGFTVKDDEDSAGVVLINRAMMKKFWQDVDFNPVGSFLIIGKGMGTAEDLPRQIVGVVADVREGGLAAEPTMYVPVAQLSNGMNARNNRVLPLTWVIRTADDRVGQASLEQELRTASGGLPLGRVRTMQAVVAASSARARFYVLLLTVFGVVALLLASVGLYGVMAYSVQQRTREIGLRMALGAEPRHIRNMVVWQGMRLALLGIAAGIPGALALTRVMVSVIFGLKLWDPAVLGGVSVLLAAVALFAAYSPSLRASRVSPCESLRQ